MSKLSVVIIAQNEERTIGEVLHSIARIADEIILVDSGSTDRTKEIAQQQGAKVYHQDWLGYATQKNFALDLASGDWILSLDADEVVCKELAEEINNKVRNTADDCLGYKIPRLLFIGSTAIKHGGFYPDAQLRLFKRGAGKFNNRLVHEAVKIQGKVGHLKHDILHYAYTDINDFEKAMDKYARLSADESLRSGFNPLKTSLFNRLVHPIWTFVFRYILKAGFMDGQIGLQTNLIYSNYVRSKIIYLQKAIDTN